MRQAICFQAFQGEVTSDWGFGGVGRFKGSHDVFFLTMGECHNHEEVHVHREYL